MIEKDIIDKIIGFDVHVLTQNNEKKTLSFLDFVNEQNSEITIAMVMVVRFNILMVGFQ